MTVDTVRMSTSQPTQNNLVQYFPQPELLSFAANTEAYAEYQLSHVMENASLYCEVTAISSATQGLIGGGSTGELSFLIGDDPVTNGLVLKMTMTPADATIRVSQNNTVLNTRVFPGLGTQASSSSSAVFRSLRWNFVPGSMFIEYGGVLGYSVPFGSPSFSFQSPVLRLYSPRNPVGIFQVSSPGHTDYRAPHVFFWRRVCELTQHWGLKHRCGSDHKPAASLGL